MVLSNANAERLAAHVQSRIERCRQLAARLRNLSQQERRARRRRLRRRRRRQRRRLRFVLDDEAEESSSEETDGEAEALAQQ